MVGVNEGIDCSPLSESLLLLEKALVRSRKCPEDEELRDAVILRFQYVYERSWKLLKRVLEALSANPEAVDYMSFSELIREGFEKGLLKSAEAWFGYRKARSMTLHTYSFGDSKRAYSVIEDFFLEAKALLVELEKRSGGF